MTIYAFAGDDSQDPPEYFGFGYKKNVTVAESETVEIGDLIIAGEDDLLIPGEDSEIEWPEAPPEHGDADVISAVIMRVDADNGRLLLPQSEALGGFVLIPKVSTTFEGPYDLVSVALKCTGCDDGPVAIRVDRDV